MAEFNINHYVSVKLTPIGEEIVRKHWAPYSKTYPTWLKPDAEGWTQFQLWELMNLFGPFLDNGCQVPFETTIRFDLEQ